MNIEPIQEGLLRVWLTEEELHQWGLSEESPDLRRVRRLVRRAMAAAGQRPGRVTAELIPVVDGGVLLISPRHDPQAGAPAVYRLEADALIDLWERWPPQEPLPMCALYEMEEAYWLAVYPDEPLTSQQVHLLLEYGAPVGGGEGAAAHAAEYGRLVALGDWLIGCGHRPPKTWDRWR